MPPTPCSSVSPTPGLSRWPHEHRRHLHRAPHARAGCCSYAQQRAEIARAVAWPAAAALAFAVLVAVTWGTWGDLAHDTGYDFVAAQRIADGQLAYQDFPYIYGPLGLAVLAGAFNYLSISIDTAIGVGLRHGHGRHRAHLRPRAAAHRPARRGAGGHAGRHGGIGHRKHRPRDPALRLGLDGRGGFARRPPGRRGLHAERESRAPRPRRRGRGGGAPHPSRVRGRHRDRAGGMARRAHPAGRGTGTPACARGCRSVRGHRPRGGRCGLRDDPEQGLVRLAHSREPLPPRAAGRRRRRRAPRVRADDGRELCRARREPVALRRRRGRAAGARVVRAPWVAGGAWPSRPVPSAWR